MSALDADRYCLVDNSYRLEIDSYRLKLCLVRLVEDYSSTEEEKKFPNVFPSS